MTSEDGNFPASAAPAVMGKEKAFKLLTGMKRSVAVRIDGRSFRDKLLDRELAGLRLHQLFFLKRAAIWRSWFARCSNEVVRLILLRIYDGLR